MTVWVLGKFGFNLSDLLGDAVEKSGGKKVLDPGLQYGKTGTDQARLHLAGAGPGARHRRPAARADALLHRAHGQGGPQVGGVGHLADRHLLPVHPGRSATAPPPSSGPKAITAAPGKANSAAPLLAYELGGALLLGVISAVAFATILAVVAGLTITAARILRARHLQPASSRRARPPPRTEVRVARITAVVIGIIAILGGILANGPEHRVPRGPRLRRRGVGEPADDPLLAVLEAVHHPGRALVDLRRPDHGADADHLQPGGVRQAGRPGRRASAVDDHTRRSTSTGSRWTTRASSRSRWPSSSAGSAP